MSFLENWRLEIIMSAKIRINKKPVIFWRTDETEDRGLNWMWEEQTVVLTLSGEEERNDLGMQIPDLFHLVPIVSNQEVYQALSRDFTVSVDSTFLNLIKIKFIALSSWLWSRSLLELESSPVYWGPTVQFVVELANRILLFSLLQLEAETAIMQYFTWEVSGPGAVKINVVSRSQIAQVGNLPVSWASKTNFIWREEGVPRPGPQWETNNNQ